MKYLALILVVSCALGGCATTAAVEEANANVEALRTDLGTFTEEIKATGSLNEEQQASLDNWTTFAEESLDDIQASLEPVDLAGVGSTISSLAGLIGGPVGAGGGILGGILLAFDQRRRRKRTVRGVVASVEVGRDATTGVVDFEKVAKAQSLMGIRREVRDVTMEVNGELAHE